MTTMYSYGYSWEVPDTPAASAPPSPPAGNVIGTSPTTGEVLVKDDDGNMSWQPGTTEQINSVTNSIQSSGEYGSPRQERYVAPITNKAENLVSNTAVSVPLASPSVAVDYETGKQYDVTDPAHPTDITPIPAYSFVDNQAVYNPNNTAGIPDIGSSAASSPSFGTPDYTNWYYTNPAGPGFSSLSSVETPNPVTTTNAVPFRQQVPPEVVVIGTSPTTNEVLVRDLSTGDMYWKPGTQSQINVVSAAIQRSGADNPDSAISKIMYQPPSGVTSERPSAGSLAGANPLDKVLSEWGGLIGLSADGKPMFNGTDDQWNSFQTALANAESASVKVYTFRGDTVEVPLSTLQSVGDLSGENQYKKYVELGILQDGQFVPGKTEEDWSYIPQWQVNQQQKYQELLKDFESRLPTLPVVLQDAYKAGGIDAYNEAVAKIKADYEANILPTMPQDYQDAYKAGNADQMEKLEKKYAQEFKEYEDQMAARAAASERLVAAGFIDPSISPEARGMARNASKVPLKSFTIPEMAEYARNNPDGLQDLKNYGFLDPVINEVQEWNKVTGELVAKIDAGVTPSGSGLSRGLSLSSGEITALDSAIRSIGVNPKEYGSYIAAWRSLDDDQKRAAAAIWDKDYSKGNAFSAMAKDIDTLSSENLALSLLFSPIQPITSPIGKQFTLEAARKQLAEDYSIELSAVKDYVSPDGSVDIDRFKKDMGSNPDLQKEVLSKTGYDSTEALTSNLEYINYATRVTPKEWATAGLVALLDIASVGGIGALGGLGAAGRILGETINIAAPISLGVIQAPDTVKAILDPTVGVGSKVFAGVGEAGMFFPVVGPALRSLEFARTIARSDYFPLRSQSMEAQTPRLKITPEQVQTLRQAGITDDDIIQAGLKLNQQLVKGAKIARVELGPITFEMKNVPYQRARSGGVSIFNATPDITLIERGGGVSTPVNRSFFTAVKVAIEPMIRSYLTGQRAVKPGINEIIVSDPEILAKIMPQNKLLKYADGSIHLEPEYVLPSRDALEGMGYRLEPIPGKSGRGVSYDAALGKIEIRRYTLSKVVDNPNGLVNVKVGGSGPGGVVGIGDLHNTANYKQVFNDINSAFKDPVLKGNPDVPSTWQWSSTQPKGRSVVQLGDSIDRGPARIDFEQFKGSAEKPSEAWKKLTPEQQKAMETKMLDAEVEAYKVWSDNLNRLQEQARAAKGDVARLLGNHELAYLIGDEIKGILSDDIHRSIFQKMIKDNILAGKLKAAYAVPDTIKPGYAEIAGKYFKQPANGKGVGVEVFRAEATEPGTLFTHAGVSLDVFPEFKGRSPTYVADALNDMLLKAVEKEDFSGKLFAKGRVEKLNSLATNERRIGGPLWMRPQEPKAASLDLGFRQVVGHNPGEGVRQIWRDNFIEADVGRRHGGTGAYMDTPYMKSVSAKILTQKIPGSAPNIATGKISAYDKLKKLIDTDPQKIADIDTPAIRKLNLSDAVNVPGNLARDLETYIKSSKGYLMGSFAEWVRVGKSVAPNDIDLVFPTMKDVQSALSRIAKIARSKGFSARVKNTSSGVGGTVEILKNGKWTSLVDASTEAYRNQLLANTIKPKNTIIDGFKIETLGTQAVGQRIGVRSGEGKLISRAARLDDFASQIMDVVSPPPKGKMGKIAQSVKERITSEATLTKLKATAMRDTVADVFLGWDGRIYAIEQLKESTDTVKKMLKDLDRQIKERLAAKDTVGAEYLARQKSNLTSPAGSDYLYGGIGFWRDLVMGRQRSTKVRDTIGSATPPQLSAAIAMIGNVRSSITRMSNYDVQNLFGRSRQSVLQDLNTTNIQTRDIDAYRANVSARLDNLKDIVDDGLSKSISQYMDAGKIASEYASRLDQELERLRSTDGPYDIADVGDIADIGVRTVTESGNTDRDATDIPEPVRDESTTPPPGTDYTIIKERLDEKKPDRNKIEIVSPPKEVRKEESRPRTEERSKEIPPEIRYITPPRRVEEDRAPGIEDRRIEDRGGEDRGPGYRPPETRPPEYRSPETRSPEYRPPETRAPDQKRPVEERPPRLDRFPNRPPTIPPYTEFPYKPYSPVKPYIPYRPPIINPPPPPPPIKVDLDAGGGRKSSKIPQGSITWASGQMRRGKELESRWWYIPPPYDKTDAIPLAGPPDGAKDAGRYTPGETLQILGEAGGKVPHLVHKDLGMVDIAIVDGRTILFQGKGLKTNVGVREPSPATGVTIEEGEDSLLPPSSKPVKKTQAGKQKRKSSEQSPATTLKSLKA